MEFETVIGLEVHAQLLTRSKAFCACSARFGGDPNSNTCPVCLGLPGALPVLNREAVIMAVKAALALNCRVQNRSIFARKNYFYPDMPKGYQISQYELPLATRGWVEILSGERNPAGAIVNRKAKRFGIHRVHMEDDAGKSMHQGTSGKSRIDLNRSGTPLIEIVSEPDLRSSQEAYDYMSYLRKVLLYLGVCDGNMEEGSLRCDANISLRPRGESKLGVKVEIKNVNSFRFLQKALDYEVGRQESWLKSGKPVIQETRLWDEKSERTFSMRNKEEAHDYRYFPEPDLPPLLISPEWLEEIGRSLPELPDAIQKRLEQHYGLSEEEAQLLTTTPATSVYFQAVVDAGANAKAAARWILGDLAAEMNQSGAGMESCPVSSLQLAELLRHIEDGKISGKMAKTVLAEMFANRESADRVIDRMGLAQISDDQALTQVIEQILSENAASVDQYRAGKEKLFGFFVGQVMKKTGGQANPKKLNDLLKLKLGPSGLN